jgi:hypothetical protein
MNRTGLICALAIVGWHALWSLSRTRFARRPAFSCSRDRQSRCVCAASLSAVDSGTQSRRVDLGAAGGPCRRRACDQTHFAVAQIVDAGPSGRFLIATMILAPGIMANVVLKEHWGRSRPIDAQFGGNEHFVSWRDRRGDCPANCSFVSGDVAGVSGLLRRLHWLLRNGVLWPTLRPLPSARAWQCSASWPAGIFLPMSSLRVLSPISSFGLFTPSSIAGRARACRTMTSIARSVAWPGLHIIFVADYSLESRNN